MADAEDKLRRYDESLHEFLLEMDKLYRGGGGRPEISSLSNTDLRVWHNSKDNENTRKEQFEKVKSLYQKLEKAYQDLDLPHTTH